MPLLRCMQLIPKFPFFLCFNFYNEKHFIERGISLKRQPVLLISSILQELRTQYVHHKIHCDKGGKLSHPYDENQ